MYLRKSFEPWILSSANRIIYSISCLQSQKHRGVGMGIFLGEAKNLNFYPSSNQYIAISLKFHFSKPLNFGEAVALPVPTPLQKYIPNLVFLLLFWNAFHKYLIQQSTNTYHLSDSFDIREKCYTSNNFVA